MKITIGEILRIWEDAFLAGYAAHANTPWIEPQEAFKHWWEAKEKKLRLK
jgi:hypothetical protein